MDRRCAKSRARLEFCRSSEGVQTNVAALVEYVGSLPDETDERPSKRMRPLSSVPSVTIVRHELQFLTKSAISLSGSTHIQRQNVGRYLRLRNVNQEVFLTPQTNPRKVAFEAILMLDPANLSNSVTTALQVAQMQSQDPGAEGCLWASVDIDILQNDQDVNIKFAVSVNWTESQSACEPSRLRQKQQPLRDAVAALCLSIPGPSSTNEPQTLTLQAFYDAVCVPERDRPHLDLPVAEIQGLSARLYPFQRRSVQWLLNREGVQWCLGTESLEPIMKPYQPETPATPISFLPVKDASGESFAISPLFGVVMRDPSPSLQFQNFQGGILAEEMGLGKTLEIISLILLHRRPDEGSQVFDPKLRRHLPASKGTLIITPASLLDQWVSEIQRHAPELDVMHYPGLRSLTKGQREEIGRDLGCHDVVVTTYDVLRTEIYAAMDPPERSMRGGQRHERARSPLVEFSWWRVCIDEAQMVEKWQSNTATMARLIPRVNAWAITGTPVKDSLQGDLQGLLTFLRYEPFASNISIWKALCSRYTEYFSEVINLICLRHTKSQVRGEIELPRQRRYVITMPFSAVEEQNYQNMFDQYAASCGLDREGNPRIDNWDPRDPVTQQNMRYALDQLRQIVLRPRSGRLGRRILGRKAGPLRTLAEVLDAMIDHSDSTVRTLHRDLLSLKLTKGQVLATLHKTNDALAIWEEVLGSSTTIVADCRQQLRQEIEAARVSEEEDRSEDEASSGNDDGEIVSPRVVEARRRLRHALEIQHKAMFFCANAYYSIKSDEHMTPPESEEFRRLERLETEGYDSAKEIRKEILQESQTKARELMEKIAESASKQDFTVIPSLNSVDQKGIESSRIVDAFEMLCAVLDEQANVLDEWREHVIQLLVKPLVDEEADEITGEEYDQSTKLSEEILVYVQALKTVLADRHQILSGQSNFLIEHEYKTTIRQAGEGEGPAPEKLLELFKIRNEMKPDFDDGNELSSLRGVITALRNLSTKLQPGATSGNQRSANELAIVAGQLKLVQKQLTEQSKTTTSLEKEADLFTETMNARMEFYRQLQAVSDMVADLSREQTKETLQVICRQEENAQDALSRAQARHRYHVHLKEAEAGTEEERLCIICRETFSIGVLTMCGHQFCKSCIGHWLRAHHNCPMCKAHLDKNSLHDITLKPHELKVHVEDAHTGSKELQTSSPAKRTGIYSEFNPEQLDEIMNIDLDGPNYTTKVAVLIRHIFWLREHDPGAKAIVFSQYKEFLDVVGAAFEQYRIGYTSFDKAKGITSFREDPSVEVFLLHARAHSSGLNLVNASHVFLCEPLLNTALELQAIARVDRIGQQHETTVWLYIVDGTVEESIYNLSVQRRMEHMGRNLKGKSKESTPELLDANLEVANSLEMQQASLTKLMGKGQISGEVVDENDLWTCLFGQKSLPPNRGSPLPDELSFDTPPYMRAFMAGQAAEERRNGSSSGA